MNASVIIPLHTPSSLFSLSLAGRVLPSRLFLLPALVASRNFQCLPMKQLHCSQFPGLCCISASVTPGCAGKRGFMVKEPLRFEENRYNHNMQHSCSPPKAPAHTTQLRCSPQNDWCHSATNDSHVLEKSKTLRNDCS